MLAEDRWREGDPEASLFGQGQRMFYTDGGEYPLMDVRTIVLTSGAADAEGVADADSTLG